MVKDKVRDSRKKQTAEFFTPPELTNRMLDKLPDECWLPDKTFCDPACGNGNMLIEVLKRKLEKGHTSLQALSTIYGTDIMEDNVKEARERLLFIISNAGEEHRRIVEKHIICTPIEKYKNGSLDFDFDFEEKKDMFGVVR